MPVSIVRAGAMITRALDRDRCETVPDGAFVQDDGIIAEVSTYEALARRHPRLPVVGTAGDIMMPGLVNAHHHLGLTPFQLGATDLPLELWAIARMGARDVDPYLDTLHAAFELVASGVTTVQHICDTAEGSVDAVKARLDAVIRAYRDIGMRASVSYGIADQNFLVVDMPDREFVASLPDGLAKSVAAILDGIEARLDGGLDIFRALHAEHRGSGRIRIQLAPANLHWCSDRALAAIGEAAERCRVPVHMHLLETPRQREYARRRCGGSALVYLERFGLAGPHMTIGHGVWMDGADVEAAARAGTSVCLNVSSNLRLRSGRAPLAAFEAAGINTAIGIDEAGLNDDRDMLQEMRLVWALNRDPRGGEPAGAGQVLRMATVGGAATTGFAGAIGTIEPGRSADVTFLDRQAMCDPHVDAEQPLFDVILHRGRPRCVRLVMCAGDVIYEDGRFAHADRDAVRRELRSRLSLPPTGQETHRRRIAEGLLPHVRDFYRRD